MSFIHLPHSVGLDAPKWPFALNRYSPQAQGLVSWWPFGNGARLPFDLTGRGHNANFGGVNNVTDGFVPNLGLPSKNFDGTGNSLLEGPQPVDDWGFTMTCWFLLNSSAADATPIFVGSSGSFNEYAHLYTSTIPDFGTRRRTLADGEKISDGMPISTGVWYFGAGTFTSEASTPYLNGIPGTPETNTLGSPGTPWNKGAIAVKARQAEADRLNGSIADPRWYNRVLTAQEIWAIYNPATRWDLYHELGRRSYFFVSAVLFTSDNLALHHSGASDIGGAIGAALTDDALNNIWDDVSSGDASAGDTEYRCTYVKNTHGSLSAPAAQMSISADPTESDFALGLGAAGKNGTETEVADEDTAPGGVTFGGGPVVLGTLGPGDFYPVWIRRTVTAGAGAATPDTGKPDIVTNDPN